jgi:hypothetical protein
MKENLKKIILPIFTISLALFMVLGVIIVLVQLFSIITLNGALSVSVYEGLKLWAIRFSAIAGFAGFAMSYLKKKTSAEA